jgi:hypothetical protein
LTPGPISYLIYEIGVSKWPGFALGLSEKAHALANLIASFSFTTLGFLAAVITILFAVASTPDFKSYVRKGYLDLLFFLYFFTLINLVFTAFVSLTIFSSAVGTWGLRLLLMSFVNNIIQVALITLVICNLARKASHST